MKKLNKMDNKQAKQLMKEHGHTFLYCKLCGPTIICGYCGNNVCNAGSGSYKTGEWVKCPNDCKEANEIDNMGIHPILYRIRYFFQFYIGKYSRKISNYFYRMFNKR